MLNQLEKERARLALLRLKEKEREDEVTLVALEVAQKLVKETQSVRF